MSDHVRPSDHQLSVEELDALISHTIDEIKADMFRYDERVAIQAEKFDDDKTTAQRAIDALQRQERFRSEHQVARAYLRQCAPHMGIFRREKIA